MSFTTKISEKLYATISKNFPEEKKKRKLELQRDKMKDLAKCSQEELMFLKIQSMVEIDNMKRVYGSFCAVIIVSIVFGVWNKFFDFMIALAEFDANVPIDIQAIFPVITFVATVIVITIIGLCILYVRKKSKDIREVYEQILLIEEIQMREKK